MFSAWAVGHRRLFQKQSTSQAVLETVNIAGCCDGLKRPGWAPTRGADARARARVLQIFYATARIGFFDLIRDQVPPPPFLPPPSRTNWTRLVPTSVLTGHATRCAAPRSGGRARGARR